jgi:folylpolyglutamate synthase
MQFSAPISPGKSKATSPVGDLVVGTLASAKSNIDADLMSIGSDNAAVTALTVQKALANAWHQVDQKAQTHVLKSIEEAIDVVHSLEGDVRVLVTGSLHLVGGFLEALEPRA